MRRSLIFTAIAIPVLISIAAITVPPCQGTLYNQKWSSEICVKSYSAGAILTNDYSDAERLAEYTSVSASSNGPGCSPEGQPGLQARLRSNATDKLHSVWESVDPVADITGRHALISRNIEDLTGIFSVDRFIQLWPNGTAGSTSVDWLPCS